MPDSTSLETTVNPLDHGASGDGSTDDTAALQAAIDEAANNGNPLSIPAGRYLTGTLHLRSHLHLHLEKDAVLLGSRDLADYALPVTEDESRWKPQNSNWHRALLQGEGVGNVTIDGEGTIDGQQIRDPEGEAGIRGPHTVRFCDAHDILVRDIRICHSGNYANLFFGCRNCRFENLTIEGGWDGVHLRFVEDVAVRACRFATGDDCVAGHTWKNVSVDDSELNTSCNGVRVFSEIEGLTVRNCRFAGPGKHPHIRPPYEPRFNMKAAIIIQPGAWHRAPSHNHSIHLENLVMENVMTALHCSLREGNSLDGLTVRNLTATEVYGPACSVESWGHPIRDVSIENYRVDFVSNLEENLVDEWESAHFGTRPLPAWGFYARNIEGLELHKAAWNHAEGFSDDALRLDQVKEPSLDGVEVNGEALSST